MYINLPLCVLTQKYLEILLLLQLPGGREISKRRLDLSEILDADEIATIPPLLEFIPPLNLGDTESDDEDKQERYIKPRR